MVRLTALALLLASNPVVATASACATGHLSLQLNRLAFGTEPAHLYWGVEGAGSVSFFVRASGDDCTGQPVWTNYETRDGTAVAGIDYQPRSGRTPDLFDPVHRPGFSEAEIAVPILDDAVADAIATKALTVELTGGGAQLLDPNSAPVHIVDDDGTARVSLGLPAYRSSESHDRLLLPVFRAGADVGGPASVGVESAPSGSSPATPGEDFLAPSSSVSFAPGERLAVIVLPIVNDSKGEPDETLAVTLSGPGVVEPSTTIVTIGDNEETIPPTSRFHHPRQGKRYAFGDYRIREVHVFTADLGSGVVERTEFALRRRRINGTCAWWNGSRFKAGPCARPRWIDMKVYEPHFFYVRLPKLAPSVGTRIRNYTALARAWDAAGNPESGLIKGRNRSTFEVKRKRS